MDAAPGDDRAGDHAAPPAGWPAAAGPGAGVTAARPPAATDYPGRVSIEVSNESGVDVDESLVASVARFALDALSVSPAAELSILAVTEEVMSELHVRWMDEPGPTDVMSFPMDELMDTSRRPDAPEPGPALLGDIVLCPEFARAQARTAGHTLSDELHLLTTSFEETTLARVLAEEKVRAARARRSPPFRNAGPQQPGVLSIVHTL